MNILKEADIIVNKRGEEKERQYGPFISSMAKASRIASEMSSKTITIEDCYNILIALKFSRESHSHKEDNLLDACAYIGSLNNYKNGK
tara:strand:+ start:478 stop:741 length:264 start_codon:yes stop_codon:yes gene_type:complete